MTGIGLTSISNLPRTEITTKIVEEFTSPSQLKSNLTSNLNPKPITTEVLTTEITDLDPKTKKPIKISKTVKTQTKKPLISQDIKVIDSSSFSFDPKIIPSIILGVLVPASCLFIVFLWSGYTSRTAQIGRYISENIEIKINRHYFATFVTEFKPISWETYMQSEKWDPGEGLFVIIVFTCIALPSSISPILIFGIHTWFWWCLSPIITSVGIILFIFRVLSINQLRNSKNSQNVIKGVTEIRKNKNALQLLAWKKDSLEIMKVAEIIKRLEVDGWYLSRIKGSHRQYKHPVKSGLVTVPGKPSKDLAIGTLKSILKQAQLEEN